ncbi:MAG: alpha-L-fucosidase [Bacteroidaceae bacterium]|nr:alpha-L-fucosidase [Bacteroidaceae bacterium]
MRKRFLPLLFGIALITQPSASYAQNEFQVVESVRENPDNEPQPVHPLPHARQLMWNETEFYAFFHYGINTYTNKEWGDGSENPSLFAPTAAPDPKQWLEAAKSAGMQGGIAVVKHHDGFCLWPTATTSHNVTASSNEYAKATNIPKDFAAAAKELGMKYGFYVSPWDRNSGYYGDGTNNYVEKLFIPQCTELAAYGDDQFEMWFDGANGGSGYYGGANESRSIDASTYYDIPNLRHQVHQLCPNCVMWGVGGEARWIGNEAGWAGETNWLIQNNGRGAGANTEGAENGWLWLPGESDAKATTKGWFWHEGEDVLSAERLFQMYLETVGRNATLILNLPPDKSGKLPTATVNRMAELGNMLKTRLANDLAKTAKVTVSETRAAGAQRNYEASNIIDDNKDTYWAANDGSTSATITFEWDNVQTVRYVTMMEYVKLGQRVKNFTIETSENGVTWTKQGGNIKCTTIGYKRIIPLNGSTSSSYSTGYKAKYVRITINDSKACPTLHTVSIF